MSTMQKILPRVRPSAASAFSSTLQATMGIWTRRVQGQALGGVGILLDRAGKDDYHAAMWAQGFGGPLGFGVLDDLEGNDHYYCGGMWRDSYYPRRRVMKPGPGHWRWTPGRGRGGIGVILDGSGDDVYEYDYFGKAAVTGSHGIRPRFLRQRSPIGRNAKGIRRQPSYPNDVRSLHLRVRLPLCPWFLL